MASSPAGSSRRNRELRSGSALLIILGCVALLTVLVLSFFVTSRTEFASSNFYARGVNTELLSENVINLIEAQLREGARSSDITTNQPVAWASQPGMIRTYDNAGNPHRFYKLYSSDTMNGALTVPFNGNSDAPTTGWGLLPNVYTDLNEPITTAGGGTEYPIIDPAALGAVEGFSFTAQNEPSISNTLPMPVKWMYVLKNGNLAVGTAATGAAVTVAGASTSNPIIGRVAFWTDDETSKVNINTASEGTYWSQPVSNNYEELGNFSTTPYGYSTALPAAQEYQRIPGHPATTSLSPIFGYGTTPVLPNTSLTLWPVTSGATGTYVSQLAPYYSITPRYAAGGSESGSQPPYTAPSYTTPGYRLFDSVDELAYDPARTGLTAANAALYPNASPTGRIAFSTRAGYSAFTPQVINQRRFFLTAHSRAPEETLFGTPRISLWPLQAQTQARTAKDNLLAFCSTINGNPYYFQRATYFQYIPSAGGSTTTTMDANNNPSSSSQSTTQDFPDPPTAPGATASKTGVQRNEDLYGYLQALTGQAIPGFGGSFVNKYPGTGGTTDRDEILTQMFDLIRCGINTIDLTPNIYPNYSFTLYPANPNQYAYPGAGSAVPIAINTNPGAGTAATTHGLGRIYNIAEVSLGLMASDIDLNDGQIHGGESSAIPLQAAGALDPTNSTALVPTGIRRISIGANLPWACEEDYWAATTPRIFMYFDTSTMAYGNYYISMVSGSPVPTIYQSSPATQVPASAIPVPIFCYWDTDPHSRAYGSYFCAPTGAPNAGNLFICASPPNPPAALYAGPPAVPPSPTPLPTTAVTIGDPQTTQVQAYLIVRPYSLVTGFPVSMPEMRIRITGLDGLKLNSQSLGFPASGSAVQVINNESYVSEYTGGGLPESWANGINNDPATSKVPGPNDGTNSRNYPFVGQPVALSTAAYPSPYGGEDVQPNLTNSGTPTSNPPPTIIPPAPIQIHNISTSPYGNPVFAGTSVQISGNQLKIDVFDGLSPTIAQAQMLQTVYVTVPSMTLPAPSIEMAGSPVSPEGDATEDGDGNGAGGPRIPGFGGNPFGTPPATSYTGTTAATYSGTPPYVTNYPALAYYYQLDYNPMVVANRFHYPSFYGSGSERMVYRGDTVRSFVLNPTNWTCGDMRLLGANPFQNSNTAAGASTDLFVPLGQNQSTWTGSPSSSYSGSQQPWTSQFLRQIHSLGMDAGDSVGMLPLVYTWAPAPPIAGGGPTPYTGIGMLDLRERAGGYGGNANAGIGQTNGSLFVYPAGTTFNPGYNYNGPLTSTILEHFAGFSSPAVTPELQGAFMDGPGAKIQGDWTDGSGSSSDGPFINKPDEGVQEDSVGLYSNNYYQTNQNFDLSLSSYSPNRQVASAVIFGTLPSVVIGGLPWFSPVALGTATGGGGVPWCTLLFCPNPAANDGNEPHPGFGEDTAGNFGLAANLPYAVPPDHLFLDLFWMPVVDPYAISEPFSTAGKVNLNYEIVPFGNYIHRSTALHAVMKSTRILAIPTVANDGCLPPPAPPAKALNVWPNVKAISYNVDLPSTNFSYRYNINLPATIDDFATTGNTTFADSQFYTRFITQGDLFRSASEICNIFLVPQAVPGSTYFFNSGSPGGVVASTPLPSLPTDALPADMESWWSSFRLTGDSGRETPYRDLYPRLTTKSNTFQVHMRVQVVTQTPLDRANGVFNASAGDSISSEYRGSAIIERYIDPNQTSPTSLPDFVTAFPTNPAGATSTVDNYVRYRVVSTHAFSP